MMNETFVAKDPKTAYALAVEKYGTEVTLISAKQIKDEDDGLYSEVIIAIPEAYMDALIAKDIEENKDLGHEILTEQKVNIVSDSEAISEEDVLLEEVAVLKKQLTEVSEEIYKDIKEYDPAMKQVKSVFIDKGISDKWIEGIYKSLLGSDTLNDANLLTRVILEEIDKTLESKKEDFSQPKVMMFVGPTGVGKTTTIAKLAARYTYLLDTSYKVALINLDSFKVGASEQLRHYSEVMELEHYTINTVKNFEKRLKKLKDYDVVLVDTAGMSPYDTEKFIETAKFIKSDVPIKIEVNLVLSATVKYEDMADIYKNFSFLNLSSLVISKFDETHNLGDLLNFMLLYHLPMSYFSMGQEVPTDLMVAENEYILERFIGDIDAS